MKKKWPFFLLQKCVQSIPKKEKFSKKHTEGPCDIFSTRSRNFTKVETAIARPPPQTRLNRASGVDIFQSNTELIFFPFPLLKLVSGAIGRSSQETLQV